MRKTWLIARNEFVRRVRSRGFILSSLGTPLLLVAIWVFTGVVSLEVFAPAPPPDPDAGVAVDAGARDLPDATIGYIDQAGVIQRMPASLPASHVRAFADPAAAAAALEAGEIDAYYVITAGYRESGEIRRYSPNLAMGPADQELVNRLLISNLVPEVGEAALRRLDDPLGGGDLAYVNTGVEDDTARSGPPPMLPFVVTMAIMLPLFTSGGYLMQSLAQEKSNRVMEILLLSIRPPQLLTGKLIGLGALTLVQYGVWALLAGVFLVPAALLAGGGFEQIEAGLQMAPLELALAIPYALGGYLIYAALMAGVGALSPDLESSRTWVFVLTIPILLPIYLWGFIVNAPFSPLAVGFSLFPFSAPVAMIMRMTTAAVPTWQLASSLGLVLLTAAGTIWLMSRLFHAQALLSGEAFSLRRAWAAIRAE